MSASVSPRQQARRSGPTVIFPSGRHDRPRLWPALSLAVGVCAGLVVLSARLSNGGIPRRPARAVPPPSVPAVPDPVANEPIEPEVTVASARSEPAWTTPAAGRAAGRSPTRAPTRAAARAPVRTSAGDAADPEREAIEREDAAAVPAVAPPPAVATAAPAPQPPPVASLPPARLFVSSQPWGRLYIDGQFIGNTPRLNVPVTPGRHRIRVSRDGYTSFDTTIAAQPETMMRLTAITLREWTP